MNTRSSKSFSLTFWYKPASSMRQLLDLHRGHCFALAVAALFGIIQFSRLLPGKSENSVWYFVFYGLGGMICLFLFGWLICNFGRWFGAEARQREVRTALGLGILPWTILFAILSLMLGSGMTPESVATQYSSIFLAIMIYGFYILILSLSSALCLGVIKTFLCLTVTLLFSLFPLTLLAQFLSGYVN